MGLFPCQPQSCEIVLGFVADSGEATGLKWDTPAAAVPANANATIATSQTTTSATYTDLTTAGPAVTITTGTKALVIVSAYSFSNGNNQQNYMSYAVSGATTVAAVDAVAVVNGQGGAETEVHSRASSASMVTLTAGSNTFTAKYRRTGSTATFKDREIFVINLA